MLGISMEDILIIRRGIQQRFENESELKTDFVEFLKENNEDYLVELQTDKIADGDFQPDESIDFDVLKVDRYIVDFNYGRYADNLEKEVYEHIVSFKEEEVNDLTVKAHVNSNDFLDLLTGKLGIINVDVEFNMTMEEYMEIKPDVNYIEQLISLKLDPEYDLENYIQENSDVRKDMVLNELIERGYSAWINPDELKPKVSVTFEAENMDLAEFLMETEELEKYERASDFFNGNNAINFLYQNCLYSDRELYSVSVYFEIEPDDYEKEIVEDVESVIILIEELPLSDYLSEYLTEEMYDEIVKEDMKEQGYPEHVNPREVGAIIKTPFIGSLEQLAERLMSESNFSLSTISDLSSTNKELLYKNKDLFSLEIAYEIEPTDVLEEL